jgi:hypothetical protein
MSIQHVTKSVTIDNPADGTPLTLSLELDVHVPDCACEPVQRTNPVGLPYGSLDVKAKA